MEDFLKGIKEAIINREVEKATDLTQKALDRGLSAEKIIYQAGTPAMEVVGQEYETGNIFLPEMLMSAETLRAVMKILSPILSKSGYVGKGKIVMGTVEGDIHNIGLDLVCMMLEGGGYQVIKLGVDVPAQKFVDAVKKNNPKIVGMSTLLTTTALRCVGVIEALQEAGLRDRVKVMIGGAAASQNLADTIGADGYGPNASAAVKLANALCAITNSSS